MSDNTRFVIRYDQASAQYAAHTIVNANSNEVIIDFSSGPIPGNDEQVLPVHTRIALSVEAAKRLASLLQHATHYAPEDSARMPGLSQ